MKSRNILVAVGLCLYLCISVFESVSLRLNELIEYHRLKKTRKLRKNYQESAREYLAVWLG